MSEEEAKRMGAEKYGPMNYGDHQHRQQAKHPAELGYVTHAALIVAMNEWVKREDEDQAKVEADQDMLFDMVLDKTGVAPTQGEVMALYLRKLALEAKPH